MIGLDWQVPENTLYSTFHNDPVITLHVWTLPDLTLAVPHVTRKIQKPFLE